MEKSKTIQLRITALRQFMEKHKLDAFIIPTSDPHGSEYTTPHDECRKWISGFSGSAGTAVVTMSHAVLWTDSRYYIAAENELKDTEFILMKDGLSDTPDIPTWLKDHLCKGSCVGLNGFVNTAAHVSLLKETLHPAQINISTQLDPFYSIWENRPPIPLGPVKIHPLQYAGESTKSKIQRLRSILKKTGCSHMLVNTLDDIAWLLNLRGNDIHCTPLFVAYCLVTVKDVLLFTQQQKITPEVKHYLKTEHIIIKDYGSICESIKNLPKGRLLITPNINQSLFEVVKDRDYTSLESPITTMKATKNKVEIEGFRHAMERDGVALVKFLRWLKPAVQSGHETEISVSNKLEQLRSEQPLYQGLSFDTIAGYCEHGAIVHYEATDKSNSPLHNKGFLLLDSGAQYLDGTTDITRTISLGEPSQKEKFIYTIVLKGHIALSRCRFPSGSSGTQLDLAARYAMWQEGYNFGHGTGHGVGSYLCVHEGPHQIRTNYKPAPISSGVIVTNEPGIYIKGQFGVRIENMLLCVPYKETDFGDFVQFEPLTLCPIDTEPIDFTLLTQTEITWLNEYHQKVRDRLLPLLNDIKDQNWLISATKNIKECI